MQHTTCVLLALLLIACGTCPTIAAEESRFKLWPFSGDRTDDAELTGNSLAATSTQPMPNATGAVSSAAPGSQDLPDSLPEQRWMFQSPLARVSWPRIHMPEMSVPRPKLPRPKLWPSKSDVDDARNAWMQQSPDPGRPTPLQAVQQGAQRVGQSTRAAWHRTVDVLTPGDATASSDPRVASRPEPPPLWKRMLGQKQPEPQGPRTVNEMLSQERLDF